MTFEITIKHYHPQHSGLDEYYSKSIEADTQRQAERIAVQSFRNAMPFEIKGECVEVYAVDGVVKEQGNV